MREHLEVADWCNVILLFVASGGPSMDIAFASCGGRERATCRGAVRFAVGTRGKLKYGVGWASGRTDRDGVKASSSRTDSLAHRLVSVRRGAVLVLHPFSARTKGAACRPGDENLATCQGMASISPIHHPRTGERCYQEKKSGGSRRSLQVRG